MEDRERERRRTLEELEEKNERVTKGLILYSFAVVACVVGLRNQSRIEFGPFVYFLSSE